MILNESDSLKNRMYIKWLEAYMDCKVPNGATITGYQLYKLMLDKYPTLTPSKASFKKYIMAYLPNLVPTIEKPRCFDEQVYRNDMGRHYPCEFGRMRKDGKVWFEAECGEKYELER